MPGHFTGQPSSFGTVFQQQSLRQEQTQRSLQASEQMLYDIYENTIGMIEELEKHEDHGKSAGYSGLLDHRAPPPRRREKHDVRLPALLNMRSTDTKVLPLLPMGGTHMPCEKVGDARKRI
ncbi:uncharacterized protein LOC110057559 [Orbicella faveolata]|uniref:uncharacterized protein LOC110057559 n=1 Tax=Orbicella faveolata TaxID=48498 RepID=UPI0009E3EA61|nr:uncharacterized protein LOC110057559 [Orbicella faveolata]